MQVIRLSQTADREAWLDMRRGKIGGSDAKSVQPLSKGSDRNPAGLWDLLAQKLAIAKDGEPERDRGQRLENEGLVITARTFALELDLDPGMWVSDINPDISVSPDAAERAQTITYAAEAKCLDSKNHIKAIVIDMIAKGTIPPALGYTKDDSYKGFNYIPKEFQHQIVQYFVVNEDLQIVYFTLYDDRIAFESLMHHVITVTREQVADLITGQLEYEQTILTQVKELARCLAAI